jgi:hemolysin III
LHRWAAAASVPAGVVLVLAARSERGVIAALVYSIGIAATFSASALVHLRAWSAARYHRLIQVDHTAIFVCIASTATAVALFALDGWMRAAMILGLWVGAALGAVVEWLPFHPPRGLMNALFLTLGWYPVIFLPAMWRGLSGANFAVMTAGALAYTVGAVVVGARRPDPRPHVFGYHEVWHLLVVVAVALHYTLVLRLVS